MGEKENPIVSVIMPAYNVSKSIGQAIDSVFEQNVPLELIIIDDCSTDNLAAVLGKYSDKDIKLLKNKTNQGVAKSRNRGVSQARGEYIAFLDSDDYWGKGKLSKQIELMKSGKYCICCTAREMIRQDGTSTGKIIGVPTEPVTYKKLLYGNVINCSSVLIKKSIMERYPMEYEESHEDYIAWLRILKDNGLAICINEPLLKYRISEQGKTHNKLKSAAMHFKALKYVGIGNIKAAFYFVSYAFKGVLKRL